MRGTLSTRGVSQFAHGIIPAHAGNTSPRRWPTSRNGDHPRACGEHTRRQPLCGRIPGSSPRMRGTLFRIWRSTLACGIIPAHAGNTRCETRCTAPHRDHPRACGEHREKDGREKTGLGSSPRMRGTPVGVGQLRGVVGIIPAHAGNTSLACIGLLAWWDHPRACGEHCFGSGISM